MTRPALRLVAGDEPTPAEPVDVAQVLTELRVELLLAELFKTLGPLRLARFAAEHGQAPEGWRHVEQLVDLLHATLHALDYTDPPDRMLAARAAVAPAGVRDAWDTIWTDRSSPRSHRPTEEPQ